jgi:ribosomal protein S18 acetylase RimI-like enzyme
VVLPNVPADVTSERTYAIRPAREADEPFLTEMLWLATTWRDGPPTSSVENVRRKPALARYVRGWGRDGDAGFIAEAASGTRVGAAWFRVFSDAEPGFGFVDERTPELSIAVVPEARCRGMGTALLRTLVAEARSQGFPAVSLSVERDNPAVALYEREGFERVRADADAYTMRLDLDVR